MTTKPAQPKHETNVAVPALDVYGASHGHGAPVTAVLHCSTQKASSGGLTSFEVFGDYRRVIERDPTVKRVTDKARATQHARNFTPELIDAYISEATGFYLNKAAKRAQA